MLKSKWKMMKKRKKNKKICKNKMKIMIIKKYKKKHL